MDRTEEMLKMWLGGMSYSAIGRHYGISRQRVKEILKPLNATRKYVVNGAEASQNGERTGLKALLDKIVLKVKKFV